MRRTIVVGLIAAVTTLGTVVAMAPNAMAQPVFASSKLLKGKLCTPTAGTGKSFGVVTVTVYAAVDSNPQLRHIVVDASTHKTGKKKLLHVYLRIISPGDPTDQLIGWAWSGKKGTSVIHLDYALYTSDDPYEIQVLFSKPSNEDCPGTNPSSFKTDIMELQVA